MTTPHPPGDDLQPPPDRPSHSRRTDIRWLVGGISAIVLIVAVAVTVIVAIGPGKDDDPLPTVNDGTGSTEPGTEYRLAEDTCEKIDTSGVPPAYKITGLETTMDPGSLICLPAGDPGIDTGFLTFLVREFGDEAEAAADFTSSRDIFFADEKPEPLAGEWTEAVVAFGGDDENPGDAKLLVRDGNLTIYVAILAPITVNVSNEEAEEAVTVLARGLMAAASP